MRKTYEMEPNRLTLETMLRTIAAAWKCTYTATDEESGILYRDRKPLALVYRAAEGTELSPLPPAYVDVIQLSRLSALAAETTLPVALIIRTESGIAALITRGEPHRGAIQMETIAGQPRAAVEIEPATWKLIPLPNSQTWRHYETARPRS